MKQAGKEWELALLECQSLALTAETGLVGRAVVRTGLSVRVPAGTLQWVPTNCCQGIARVITSVFLEPPVGVEAVLPANILISKCLLRVEQGVVYVPVVNLEEKDQWLRPKTFLGQLYMVSLQSALDTELRDSVTPTFLRL